MKQKRKQTLIAAAVLLGIIFTGCAAPQSATESPSAAAVEELTLFDTDTLEITLEGAQTRIEDKTSGNVYSFTTKKKYSTDPLTLASPPPLRNFSNFSLMAWVPTYPTLTQIRVKG